MRQMFGGLMQGEFADLSKRYSDIFLAAGVVMIIGMMIIPLPTPLLDLLLVVNITVQVTMLLIAIYISKALKLASFPTIILITTLFRLALNVSSTRLILLNADAGSVIRSSRRTIAIRTIAPDSPIPISSTPTPTTRAIPAMTMTTTTA